MKYLPRLLIVGSFGLGVIWVGFIVRVLILMPFERPLVEFPLPIPPCQLHADVTLGVLDGFCRWRWSGDRHELLYAFFRGHDVSSSHSSYSHSSDAYLTNPQPHIANRPLRDYDISDYLDRLVINDKDILVTAKTRIFVLRRDGTIMRVTMTDEELAEFTIDFAKHSLRGSALWKEKIEPLLVPSPPDRVPESTTLDH